MARGASLIALAALLAPMPASLHAAVPAFGFEDVDARARRLADAPYEDHGSNLSGPLQRLDEERWRQITFRRERAPWLAAKLPFALQFFHEGWRFDRPVRVDEVDDGVHEIAFDPAWFDYGASGIDAASAQAVGFAGLRVTYPLNARGRPDEVLSFLGASYFRALGRGQSYGMSARALAVDTALASGEEFPRIVELWAVRPDESARQLELYALVDSPRVTGAYAFELRPGDDTTITVTARLHLRADVAKLGIAPLTSMYYHGANQPAPRADYRPEVHDSDGLSVALHGGEWLWRPLVDPPRLLVTSFHDDGPRGFGLLQRAREFARYEDLDAHYERHPSVWVEPLDAWGSGRVELVEIPSPDETNDNIAAYWVADAPARRGDVRDVRYRLHWTLAPATRPPGLRVVQTRTGTGFLRKPDDATGFAIDFAGAAAGPATKPLGVASADANGTIVAHAVVANPETGGWRLMLRVRQHDAGRPLELRASLRDADLESETWSYIVPAR